MSLKEWREPNTRSLRAERTSSRSSPRVSGTRMGVGPNSTLPAQFLVVIRLPGRLALVRCGSPGNFADQGSGIKSRRRSLLHRLDRISRLAVQTRQLRWYGENRRRN